MNDAVDPAHLVEAIAERLLSRGEMLAVAESCTGGLIAKQLTDLAGSSAWFERGVVTYSNQAKSDLLAVPAAVLEHHGAVSEAVAMAMAGGLLMRAPVQWALAVTGIAGPSGGTADKPVGTVWMAWARRLGEPGQAAPTRVETVCRIFSGDRQQVREQTLRVVLEGLLQRLQAAPDAVA